MQDPEKYRGITLLSHIMKLRARFLDGRIRKREEQKLGEGIQKGQRDDRWDVCIKAAGREEVEDARKNDSGICGA